MPEKHILRKRKDLDEEIVGLRRDVDSDDEEWNKITAGVGEKIEAADIEEVAARTITFNQEEATRTKEDEYKEKSSDFKDGFGNTAQYLKFINAHLAAKKSKLDQLKLKSRQFDSVLASLKPSDAKTKEDFDQLNYKEIKSEDVRNILKILEKEREQAKERVEHFSSQLTKANEDLLTKEKQVNEIESELANIKNKELIEETELKNELQKEENPMNIVKKELSSLGSNSESEKIFGAINSLVVLLNSKNQETVNELNAMKSEFNKMKQDYEEALRKVQQSKS